MQNRRMTNSRHFLFLFLFFWTSASIANRKEGVKLQSTIDEALSVHSVLLLPTVDNVDNIYSRPFDSTLNELLSSDPQWQMNKSELKPSMIIPSDLVNSPEKVKKIASSFNSQVDALLMAEVRKNPKDFILALFLFSAKDGRLIAQSAASNLDISSMENAKKQLTQLYHELKFRVPYEGLILSRTKNRVTINLGASEQLTPGQELPVNRIINVTRHPKLGTIIQNEKIVIGKIRIMKVDKHLSFADITSEIELGAIQKDAKIIGARPLTYAQESWLKKEALPPELLLSENNLVNGKVQEWRPELPPTFGVVGANLSLGSFKQSQSFTDGSNYTGKESLYPIATIFGEMWINPEWYVAATLSQGTASFTNPAGGSPSDLTSSLSQFSLDLGYNILLKDDFFDTKLMFGLGYLKYKMSIDDSSPSGLSSAEYASPRLFFGAKTPLDDARRWYLSGTLYWYINAGLKERPHMSGTEDSKIVHYSLLLDYRWSERIWINSGLDFKTYSTDFTGAGSRPDGKSGTSGSHRFQSLLIGASYMF